MAAEKFFTGSESGVLTEKEALQSSAGAGDAGKIVSLDSTGRLDASMMPVGIGAESSSVVASENLSAGDFVNIYASSGAKCRKADASTSGKEAHGFVLEAVASGNPATIYAPSQTNTQLTGLTPGSVYFLSDTTPGAVSATAPTAPGTTVQRLGVATSTTEMPFTGQLFWIRA